MNDFITVRLNSTFLRNKNRTFFSRNLPIHVGAAPVVILPKNVRFIRTLSIKAQVDPFYF